MALSDEQFREEFKPLHVLPAYPENGSLEDKILFALAACGEAGVTKVCDKLVELEPRLIREDLSERVNAYLKMQFDKGLLNGGTRHGERYYNLNKITQTNEGAVDPDLLAPGLD
jgi:hypothetical protein